MDTGHRVLLYKGTGFVSWAIKKQTRSIYSHSAILLPDLTMVESVMRFPSMYKPGVISRQFHESEKEWCDRFIVDGHTPEQWAITEELLLGHVAAGTPYDPRGVLRFISKRSHAENGNMFCSELTFEALCKAGTKILHRTEASHVAPEHISLSPLLILDPW